MKWPIVKQAWSILLQQLPPYIYWAVRSGLKFWNAGSEVATPFIPGFMDQMVQFKAVAIVTLKREATLGSRHQHRPRIHEAGKKNKHNFAQRACRKLQSLDG